MGSLKRFYFTLATGLAKLTGARQLQQAKDDGVVSRVSREVLYYKTHFFNV